MLIKNKGLTLLELLIAVSIAAILATVAVPSMQSLIADARLSSAVSIHSSLLTFARSTAVDRNEKVTLCPTADSIQCGQANTWNSGVMAFTDRNGNSRRDQGESLLKYQPLKSGLRIFSGASPDATGRSRKRIVFSPSGSAAGSTISIKFCADHWKGTGLVLVVQNSGRIRLSDRDGSGKQPDCQH